MQVRTLPLLSLCLLVVASAIALGQPLPKPSTRVLVKPGTVNAPGAHFRMATLNENPGMLKEAFLVTAGGVPLVGMDDEYRRPAGHLTSFCAFRTMPPEAEGILYVDHFGGRSVWRRTEHGPEQLIYTGPQPLHDVAIGPDHAIYFSGSTKANGTIWRLGSDMRADVYRTVVVSRMGGRWDGDFAFDAAGALYLANGGCPNAGIWRYRTAGTGYGLMHRAEGSILGFYFTDPTTVAYTDGTSTIHIVTFGSAPTTCSFGPCFERGVDPNQYCDVAAGLPPAPRPAVAGPEVFPAGGRTLTAGWYLAAADRNPGVILRREAGRAPTVVYQRPTGALTTFCLKPRARTGPTDPLVAETGYFASFFEPQLWRVPGFTGTPQVICPEAWWTRDMVRLPDGRLYVSSWYGGPAVTISQVRPDGTLAPELTATLPDLVSGESPGPAGYFAYHRLGWIVSSGRRLWLCTPEGSTRMVYTYPTGAIQGFQFVDPPDVFIFTDGTATVRSGSLYAVGSSVQYTSPTASDRFCDVVVLQ